MASTEKVKKLMTKIRAQAERLQVLKELAETESSTNDMYLLLKEILLLTVRATKVEKGFIILHNRGSGNPFEYGATNTTEQFEDKTLLRDVCDNIVRSQKPLIINDTRLHRRLRRNKILNMIAIPMIFNKEVIGIFLILNKRKALFKKRDLALFSMISKFTSSAIMHAKASQELGNKDKELETIYAVDRIRDTIKDFNTMMEAILQEVTQVIDAKLAFFLLYNKKTNKTELKVSGQLKSSTFVHSNANSIYEISRAALDAGELKEFTRVNKEIDSAICTPIVVSDETMGVFGVLNPNNRQGFTAVDKRLLDAVAKQSDSAIFEDLEKAEIKKMFSRYVSEDVIDSMMNDQNQDFMKINRREMTVLFSDLRGFTSLSEKLEPEQIVEILNEHFTEMTEIIMKHRGTLDKFVGDEIMALFGAPIYYEGHALKAVKCALEMQQKAQAMERKLKKQFGVDITIGIGINTGEMVVGNIGSKKRTDYTVIGNNVNIAARLCSAAKAGQVIITENTYNEVKKLVKVQKLEPLQAKGKTNALEVYNVTSVVNL
ncbi:TPA: GAF domain-containing protein [Candidatus Woesearchaeota archaeon]|nr:GAF domain-containing protein [Candidatus Woesearchaeota archaeon]